MAKPTRIQLNGLQELKKADPQAEVRWSKDGGVARLRARFSPGGGLTPTAAASEFLKRNRKLFGLDDPARETVVAESHVDGAGNTHVRYQQVVGGVPVFGRQLIVHVDAGGSIVGTSGDLFPNLRVPTRAKIAADAATKAALAHKQGNKRWEHKSPLLTVLVRDEKPFLCWQVTVEGTTTDLAGKPAPARWEYFVDAGSGRIVWLYDNLQAHTQTTGTGTGTYAGAVILNTMHNHTSGNYELEDRWLATAARVFTHDAGHAGNPISEDGDNAWDAGAQGAEADCHYYTRQVYDYFLVKHGRDSFDDAGADMHIRAHYGTNLNNAYWDGAVVKIGDGDGVAYGSFCALDVIAHEWTHAITEHTAGLVYSGESGAINESMSDVFACLIDGDWLYGEDNWLGATAPASRNLADPTNGGQYDPADPIASAIAGHQPDHTDDQYTGAGDFGGVHINSGICNKAAHLIATGGTHRGIRICEALGIDVLGRLYYQALTSHLTSTSDFPALRDAILDSLDDLYLGDPKHPAWRTSINNAFAAVGIGTAMSCSPPCWLSPHLCPPQPQLVCPPQPQLACPPQPQLVCPSQPHLICPPSPIACAVQPFHGCVAGPGGCLPGPDPIPFDPEIVVQRDRVMQVRERMARPGPAARAPARAAKKGAKARGKR